MKTPVSIFDWRARRVGVCGAWLGFRLVLVTVLLTVLDGRSLYSRFAVGGVVAALAFGQVVAFVVWRCAGSERQHVIARECGQDRVARDEDDAFAM